MSPWTCARIVAYLRKMGGVSPDSAKPLEMLWIPEGFAHGFLVLSETADVLYKTTDFYYPAGERCLQLGRPGAGDCDWPLDLLGGVDAFSSPARTGAVVSFAEAEKF